MTTEFIDLPSTPKFPDLRGTEHNVAAIVSGGLDSVTLVYELVALGAKPHVLSFNYGQRHKKELQFARVAAKTFGLRHDVIDLSSLTHLISNSALTSPKSTPGNPGHLFDARGHQIGEFKDIEVPEGHYAEDNMAVTVVPNRNMIMLSIAAGIAVNYGYSQIATGIHGGDHFQYPDCRPEFIYAAGRTIKKANEGFHKFYINDRLRRELVEAKVARQEVPVGDEGIQPILAPYMHKDKAFIAQRAFELSVPLHLTWSCYKGGVNHCGKCGTCVERLEAIDLAKKAMVERYPATETVWQDHTVYDDAEYWKTVIK